MKQVNLLGNGWYHFFKMDDGSIKSVSIKQQEYYDLAKVNAPQPIIDGGTWLYSKEGMLFDTPSGELEEGYSATIDATTSLVNEKGLVKEITT